MCKNCVCVIEVILSSPSRQFVSSSDCDVELVTVSGHGRNGAVCVLQRGVRPQVVTTFELPGCIDMWTVLAKQEVRTLQHSKSG